MSASVVIFLWFLLGFLGGYLVWLHWVIEFEEYRCPTPRALFLIALVAVGGPIPFFTACCLFLFDAPDSYVRSWWTRPICRRPKHPQQNL